MRSIVVAFLLAVASLSTMAAPQASRGPMSKDEVLDLVRSSVPNRVVADAVRSYGIAFEPSEEVLKEFRKAGAGDVVIAAMRDSWHPEPAKPLGDKDILVLLAEDVRSERIVYIVQQRGIAFQPTDEYFERLRSYGAKDELIDAVRTAAAKPFNRDNLLQLLATGEDTGQIAKALQARGIEFEPSEDDFSKLRTAGAPESLLHAIQDAKRIKPEARQSPNAPESMASSQTGRYPAEVLKGARVICPPSVSSIPVFASPDDMHKTIAHLGCGIRVTILEKDSGRIGLDKILVPSGTEGFVQDLYLGGSITLANSNLTPPVPTYQPEPAYTPQARHDQIEGSVDLSIVIDAQGNVTEAREISKPLGHGLDEKAIEIVKTWKFKPATLEGVPVPTRAMFVVAFRLYR